jgi:hypothetical protein
MFISSAASGTRLAQGVDDVVQDRLHAGLQRVGADGAVRGLEGVAGALVQGVAQRHLDDGAQQGQLAGDGDRRVQRVEPDAFAAARVRVEPDRLDAQGLGDQVPLADAVLALRVQHHDLPVAEAQLAQHVRLLQRRLAVAGLAEHQPVRGRQLLAVELEGVVDVALAAVDLAPDDHAAVAEARRRRRQVDRLGLVAGRAHRDPHRLPAAEQGRREALGDQVADAASDGHLDLLASAARRWRTAGC